MNFIKFCLKSLIFIAAGNLIGMQPKPKDHSNNETKGSTDTTTKKDMPELPRPTHFYDNY